MRSSGRAPGRRTGSPYFLVSGDGADRMPLKQSHARVQIVGVIAQVKVSQLYVNEGDRTLEASYVFPASTRAAVYAMRMRVGDRVIDAEIQERAQAQQTYDDAKRSGRTASLLKQHCANVFQMDVANILPGDEIEVDLYYTELLVPTDRVYEFVYPTVVGPRYSAGGEIETAYLPEGEPSPYTVGLDLSLRSAVPVASISSSHDVAVEYLEPVRARILLADDREAGTRDFVLRYSLAGDEIQSGLLLYPGEEESFFLLLVEPPERVKPRAILPREYIFIVDVSGSMNGFPIETSKELMRNLLGSLRPVDHFNVLLFAGGNQLLAERSLQATPKNIEAAVGLVERQRGGGGTELLPALHRAMSLPLIPGRSRIVAVVTDGYVSVERRAFRLIRDRVEVKKVPALHLGTAHA